MPVNEGFAAAVLAELEHEPDAAVFFHDYHLYLAPRLVRERRPDAVTTHFIHVPWPEPDYWHVLPGHLRAAVHEGALANDVLGLHTNRWRRNFLRSCEDILGAEVDFGSSTVVHAGHRTLVTSHPIGIDPAEFQELRDDPSVLDVNYLNSLASLKAAEILGARFVRIDAGSRRDAWSNEEFDLIVSRYREYASFAGDHARHAAGAARSVAAGHSGVLGVPRCDPA